MSINIFLKQHIMNTPANDDQHESGTPAKSVEFYTPHNYKPLESIGYIVRNVNVSINRMVDARMQKYDLTAMQWRPLLMIYFGKVNTAAALAKETCMDTGATTRMLDRLQKKGLMERTRCDQDRRVIYLALTEEGKRVCAEIPTDLCDVMNAHLHGFSQDELNTLKSLLGRMLVNGQFAQADGADNSPAL